MTPTTDQLKDLLGKVTQGPWLKAKSDTKPKHTAVYADGGLSGCAQVCIVTKEFSDDEANADLIALAPTLAAEVVRLREAIERIDRLTQEAPFDFGLIRLIARQALDATSNV